MRTIVPAWLRIARQDVIFFNCCGKKNGRDLRLEPKDPARLMLVKARVAAPSNNPGAPPQESACNKNANAVHGPYQPDVEHDGSIL